MSGDTEKPLPWPPIPKAGSGESRETVAFSLNPGEKKWLAGIRPAPAPTTWADAPEWKTADENVSAEPPLQDQSRPPRVIPIRVRTFAISAMAVAGLASAIYFTVVPSLRTPGDRSDTLAQAESKAPAPDQRQAEAVASPVASPAASDTPTTATSPHQPASAPEAATAADGENVVSAASDEEELASAADGENVPSPASDEEELASADNSETAPAPDLAPSNTETASIEVAPSDEPEETLIAVPGDPAAGREGSITRSAATGTDWLQDVWKPRPFRHVVAVGRGDTLMGLLVRAGIERGEAHRAIATLRTVFDPRRLRPGQELGLHFFPAISGDRFLGISLEIEAGRSVKVARAGDSFSAREIQRELSREMVRGEGRIDSSLYAAGISEDVPPAVMADLIHIFSFDVDFQRDIRGGDSFEIMYERFRDRGKQVARSGEILYASLTLSGQRYQLWRHKTADGRVDYYNEKGHSVRKALMRTPVDGARLSSGFGMRQHPVLGYSRMHRGTDFAASRGTPIYAAGDGMLEKAGRWGAYGNYVRIRHNGTYKTAYAHMRGFARGIRAGKRVRQGQTIGYVGTSGRSTGPHLHYEVLRNGKQINSRTMRLPSGRKLKGKALAAFLTGRKNSESQFAALGAETKPATGTTESALVTETGSCNSGAVAANAAC